MRGHERVEVTVTSIAEHPQGLAMVILNGKSGFIDKAGREVIPLELRRCNGIS
jgi:hypothetical protein